MTVILPEKYIVNSTEFALTSYVYLLIHSAMRQLYLQHGGSDPVILAQMREMESEARGISKKSSKVKKAHGNFIFCEGKKTQAKLR